MRDTHDPTDVSLRQIIDGSLAFIGLLAIDGTLLEANALALQAGGLQRDDVIGRKFWDCYWWSYDDGVRQHLKAAHQRASQGEVVRYDVQVRMAGGHLMWIDFQLVPRRDESGRITHLIPSGLDLTARKLAEAELRASEQKFRGIFDNANSGVALVSLDGDWLEVNDRLCDLLGYSRDQLTAKTFQDITHPDDLQGDLDLVRRLIAGEIESYTFDKRYVRGDGSILWAALTVALQKDPAGRPRHFISIVSDITDRVRAQQHQVFLMSELAHRLKNQLSIIQAITRQSAAGLSSIDEFQDKLYGRLSALAASVDLIVHRQWDTLDLNDLVAKTLAPFSRRVITAGDRVTISGDVAEILALAFHELATNATKYGAWSRPEGSVTLRWSADNGQIAIAWVEANGPEVRAPTRRGFGRTIIETIAAKKLRGTANLTFDPAGLQWQMNFPAASTADLRARPEYPETL
jgi:PAS domain S-box-containing protein